MAWVKLGRASARPSLRGRDRVSRPGDRSSAPSRQSRAESARADSAFLRCRLCADSAVRAPVRRRRGRGTRSSRPGPGRRWPGSRGRPGGWEARARATASALSAPLTTNHTSSDRARPGNVRVTRSGGGLGDPVTPSAIASSTSSCGKPGNSEAMWPSGPTPSISRSKPAATDRPDRVGVRRGGTVDVVGVRRRGDLVDPCRVDRERVEHRRAGLPGVPVVGVRGDEALVAPEEVDPAPVDVAVGTEPGDLAVDLVGDGAAGEGRPEARRPTA